MNIYVDKKTCISCGACAVHCPAGAISLASGKAEIDSAVCISCMFCIPKCYMRAIHREMSPEEQEASPAPEPRVTSGATTPVIKKTNGFRVR